MFSNIYTIKSIDVQLNFKYNVVFPNTKNIQSGIIPFTIFTFKVHAK